MSQFPARASVPDGDPMRGGLEKTGDQVSHTHGAAPTRG